MEDDSDHQSAAFVGSIDDLLTEILVRLPAASILRFKSVCKHWRLLLSHRRFTHRYDNNINNKLSRSVGLFGHDIYAPFDVENQSPPPFRRSSVKIEQSCNGLLLCSSAYHNNDATEYYVFNPTTKQLEIIPPVPKYIWTMALAFHQTDCVHYKVVCIRAPEPDGDVFEIQIYSSDTGKWKICVESFSLQKPKPFFRQPVYWNGAVHWAPFCGDFLYFKLDVEQLQMLSVPEGLMAMYFGESSGHLHLISRIYREENSLIVYEMLMDHSGWFVKYRVQLDDELLGAFPEMINQYYYNFEVVDVVRCKEEEEEEDTFLVLVTPMKMIRYNVHNKSFKELYSQKYSYKNITLKLLNFHRYIQTLSSF